MIDFVKNKNDMELESGVYDGIDFEDYLKINAISKSAVSHSKSNLEFLKYRDSEFVQSASMQYGSLVDCLLLEPEFFEKRYIVSNENLRTKKGKEIKAQAKFENKTLIKESDFESANYAKEAVYKNDIIKDALDNSIKQRSFFIKDYLVSDNYDNIPVKGRFDFVTSDAIWDLKTAIDTSSEGFGKAFINFGYYIQAGLYTDAFNLLADKKFPFRFLCVSNDKSKNPDVQIYEIDFNSFALWRGRSDFENACNKIINYSDDIDEHYKKLEIKDLEIPRWFV